MSFVLDTTTNSFIFAFTVDVDVGIIDNKLLIVTVDSFVLGRTDNLSFVDDAKTFVVVARVVVINLVVFRLDGKNELHIFSDVKGKPQCIVTIKLIGMPSHSQVPEIPAKIYVSCLSGIKSKIPAGN